MKGRVRWVLIGVLSLLMILSSVAGSFAAPVEVTLWYFGGLDTELRVIPQVISDFNKQNPGIVIKGTHYPWDSRNEKIVTAFRDKSLPDLIMGDSMSIADFVGMGILTPYDVEFPQYFAKWKPLFVPDIWDQLDNDQGHKYGIGPYSAAGPMIIFDPLFIKKAGLTGVPRTFSDLIDWARVIKSKGYIGVSVPASRATNDMQIFIDIAFTNGGRLLSPDGKQVQINSPAWVETLKLYGQLAKEGLLEEGATQASYIDALKLVVSNKAGIGMGKDWIYGIVYDIGAPPDRTFNLSRFPVKYPPVQDKYAPAGLTLEGGSDMMMVASSKVKDSAIKFVDYYSSNKVLINWGGDPVRGRVPNSHVAYTNPAFKKYNPFLYQQYKDGSLFKGSVESPNFRGLAEMYPILSDAVQAVILGQMEPQQALDDAQKKCQDVLDTYVN